MFACKSYQASIHMGSQRHKSCSLLHIGAFWLHFLLADSAYMSVQVVFSSQFVHALLLFMLKPSDTCSALVGTLVIREKIPAFLWD